MPERMPVIKPPESWPPFSAPDSEERTRTHKVISEKKDRKSESFAKVEELPTETPPKKSGVRSKRIYELPIKKFVKEVPPEQPEEITAGLGTMPLGLPEIRMRAVTKSEKTGLLESFKDRVLSWFKPRELRATLFGMHPVGGRQDLPPFIHSKPDEEKGQPQSMIMSGKAKKIKGARRVA